MTRADAIVVGGGLAGGAVAAHLAGTGRHVVLFEREARAGHKVCGEFLSGDTVLHLRDLGIVPAALGAASIGRVSLSAGGRPVTAGLPFAAWGLSRRRLDESLLSRAAARGAEVRRGRPVRRLECCGRLWQANGVEAPVLFLATGKHDLRGHGRPGGGDADPIGLKMHFRLSANGCTRLAGRVEMLFYDGGYAGLQLVEDDVANLCLLVSRRRYVALDRRWDRLLAVLSEASPVFADCFSEAQSLIDRPLAVAGIPYGHVHAPGAADPPTLYRLGDQFAVMPPFVGDGMAIALHSARMAADAFLAGATAGSYHRALRRAVWGQVRAAGLVSRALKGRLGRELALAACRLAPPAMAWIAARTRVPVTSGGRGEPPPLPETR